MRGRLDDIVHAIARAETNARAPGTLHWESLKNIIELMEKHDTMEWMKGYYSEEQLADLHARGTPEVVAQGEQDWRDLLAEVEAALHEDPASEHAQSLAARWSELIERFTGGDPGIAANLQRLYADKANWPADFKKPFSDEASAFIARATAARRNEGSG
ncbi:MAG: TipAS antibiotic-recognition domain-containing protein [Candidatus Eremiobacteraeota bacterium]|nr:TipAS antibiotic-recognition domain-containing protein [Candidatus Eremiobacteraeota bacterium]